MFGLLELRWITNAASPVAAERLVFVLAERKAENKKQDAILP